MKISRLLRALTGHFTGFSTGFFLGVFLTFLTAAGDALLLPYALASSFCCFDDCALRRHIHSIPLHYIQSLQVTNQKILVVQDALIELLD
jgi:hypothetical protein